jgi:hypothetical protein
MLDRLQVRLSSVSRYLRASAVVDWLACLGTPCGFLFSGIRLFSVGSEVVGAFISIAGMIVVSLQADITARHLVRWGRCPAFFSYAINPVSILSVGFLAAVILLDPSINPHWHDFGMLIYMGAVVAFHGMADYACARGRQFGIGTMSTSFAVSTAITAIAALCWLIGLFGEVFPHKGEIPIGICFLLLQLKYLFARRNLREAIRDCHESVDPEGRGAAPHVRGSPRTAPGRVRLKRD